MALLAIGLALFFSVHLAPMLERRRPGPRKALIARIGLGPYKGLVSVISLIGMVLMVRGYVSMPFIPIYEPPAMARGLAHGTMPLAFLLAAASQIPSNIKRTVRHPMMLATLIWALTHLVANGDLASLLLFASFAGFAVISIALAPPSSLSAPYPRIRDLAVILVGLGAYGAVLWAHGGVFGVAVIGG